MFELHDKQQCVQNLVGCLRHSLGEAERNDSHKPPAQILEQYANIATAAGRAEQAAETIARAVDEIVDGIGTFESIDTKLLVETLSNFGDLKIFHPPSDDPLDRFTVLARSPTTE
eukprot:c20108_g1_i2.p4 GENE.c20108_g1_i2~~c20108_g1_i2.p4  ORF type:complete len:115 (-),score=27.43 c20108_g1_i2:936-1280(-)